MSKYNVGDKFMIEIDKKVRGSASDPDNLYRIKGFNSLVFDDFGLDKLNKAPVRLYTDREVETKKKESYNVGLKDAWEVVRKIVLSPDDGGIGYEDLKAIFGIGGSYQILRNFPVSEAIEKIKEYEEEKEKIHVGDVLQHNSNKDVLVVVTKIRGSGYFDGIKISEKSSSGDLFSHYSQRDIRRWTKTGRYFDLKNIFCMNDEDELPFS